MFYQVLYNNNYCKMICVIFMICILLLSVTFKNNYVF